MSDIIIFSVIIPIFDVEPYLRKCLDSVCSQNIKNIEIICVDDASPDACSEIVRTYAERDSRIHYVLHDVNRGLAAARNTGLDLAKGEYVLFVDADDYLRENALQVLFNTVERERAQVIYFNLESFHDNDQSYTSPLFPDFATKDPVTGKQVFETTLNDHYFRGSVCAQCWRRDVLQSKGLRFIEGIYHEDTLFSLYSQLAVERAVVIPDILYQYRIRRKSIMTDPDKVIARKLSLLFIYGKALDLMDLTCKQSPSLLPAFYNYLDTLSVMLDFTYAADNQLKKMENVLNPDSREYYIYRVLKGADGCFINWKKFDYSILTRYQYYYLYGNGRVAAEVLRHLGGICAFAGVISPSGSFGSWHGLRLLNIDSHLSGACLIYASDFDDSDERAFLSSLADVFVYYPPR